MKSLEAIAQLARDHGLPFRLALGFTRLDSPCKASLSNLLRALDIDTYERVRADGLAARCPYLGDTLARDGKTLRGSGGYQVPGVHLLAAYAPQVRSGSAPQMLAVLRNAVVHLPERVEAASKARHYGGSPSIRGRPWR
jgi:hypothetical protein